MATVRHDYLRSKQKLLIHRRTTAELAEFAWNEGLKFCRLKHVGRHNCAEPCDRCYQTALNFLIRHAQRMRKRNN